LTSSFLPRAPFIQYPTLNDVINQVKAWGEAIKFYKPNQPYFNIINQPQTGTPSQNFKTWVQSHNSNTRVNTIAQLGRNDGIVLPTLPVSFIWTVFNNFYLQNMIQLKSTSSPTGSLWTGEQTKVSYEDTHAFFDRHFDMSVWEQFNIIKALRIK